MALTGHQEAMELLLIEEADAWFEYLESTRAQSAIRYVEVEPWAWARLSASAGDPRPSRQAPARRRGGLTAQPPRRRNRAGGEARIT
jgi:hypothetical protein